MPPKLSQQYIDQWVVCIRYSVIIREAMKDIFCQEQFVHGLTQRKCSMAPWVRTGQQRCCSRCGEVGTRNVIVVYNGPFCEPVNIRGCQAGIIVERGVMEREGIVDEDQDIRSASI